MCAEYVKLSDTIYKVLTVVGLYFFQDTTLFGKHDLNSFTVKNTLKVFFSSFKFSVFTICKETRTCCLKNSPFPPNRHDITVILLKVALNTINQPILSPSYHLLQIKDSDPATLKQLTYDQC